MDLFFRLAQSFTPTRVPATTALYRIRDDQSNAVTAMKSEFVATRTQLLNRYANVIMPSLAEAMEEGKDHITALLRRVQQLEDEIRDRGGSSS